MTSFEPLVYVAKSGPRSVLHIPYWICALVAASFIGVGWGMSSLGHLIADMASRALLWTMEQE